MSEPTVSRGDSGPAVTRLVQSLIEAGFPPGPGDAPGTFGEGLQSAVVAYQAAHALTPDGVVGPRSWAALGGADTLPAVDPPPVQMPPPGYGRAAVALVRAAGELAAGVREVPPGSNRGQRIDLYTGLLGRPAEEKGPAWCAYFVSWAYRPTFRFGAVQSILDWAAKPGGPGRLLATGEDPQPGDMFMVVGHHVGLVRAFRDGTIWTIEGNSGNRVAARTRPAAGLAFVRISG